MKNHRNPMIFIDLGSFEQSESSPNATQINENHRISMIFQKFPEIF